MEMLLEQLVRPDVPAGPDELDDRAKVAVARTVESLRRRGSNSDRHLEEKEKETEEGEPDGDPDLEPERVHPPGEIMALANREMIPSIMDSVLVSRDQAVSGTAGGFLLSGDANFQILGFNSVSSPRQIPIEYDAPGGRYTCMARGYSESKIVINHPLNFRVVMHVGQSELVELVRVDFELQYELEDCIVERANHGDLVYRVLDGVKRFDNLSLVLKKEYKRFKADQIRLELSVHVAPGSLCTIRWRFSGLIFLVLGEMSRVIDDKGEIEVSARRSLYTVDALTEKYFGLYLICLDGVTTE
ncbi:hypothetical protein [Amycolatopsis sp. H20-H5]|uniref:hypothetical protein n=1 Tax=Amycolatopsis sp. H20-H5 TaxID=3046309 RepID=UPI002DB69518|nr:hypothetical protein [Amycolatopsis sp. H20-H5]MEC3978748.1 hypothetical protein [Amycolatopsis sp. H20-H5]